MKRSFRSNRRSRPEKEGVENGEVEKEREQLQQEEEKEDEESDMNGDEEEAGIEAFTLDRFIDFSQSIAAETRMMNKLLRDQFK